MYKIAAMLYRYRLVGLFYTVQYLLSRTKARLRLVDVSVPLWVRKRSKDWSVLVEVFAFRSYDLLFLPENAEVIIDAGANVGYSSIWFTNRYPDAKIIAIEPESSNFQLLQTNVEPYPNIVPVRAMLAPQPGHGQILNPDANTDSFRLRATTDEGTDIVAITIKDALKTLDANKADIVKIDIEGGEKELFASNYDWIEKTSTIIIELHDHFIPGCAQTFYRAVLSKGNFQQSQRRDNLILTFQDDLI